MLRSTAPTSSTRTITISALPSAPSAGSWVPVVARSRPHERCEIDRGNRRFRQAAREGKLELEEMQGGNLYHLNGGVYGSLLSTPILNAPQWHPRHTSHRGACRVRDGQIVARALMMYLALSYDIVWSMVERRSTFLVQVKDAIEDPKRLRSRPLTTALEHDNRSLVSVCGGFLGASDASG